MGGGVGGAALVVRVLELVRKSLTRLSLAVTAKCVPSGEMAIEAGTALALARSNRSVSSLEEKERTPEGGLKPLEEFGDQYSTTPRASMEMAVSIAGQ